MVFRAFSGSLLILLTTAFPHNATANNIELMQAIKTSVTEVCDKPQNAGEHWDIRVKGDGAAKLGFKLLPKLSASGEAEFTKEEWTGIKNTIENSADYRVCVKELIPIFLKHFSETVESVPDQKPSKSLGGVQWQGSAGGIDLTLKHCSQRKTTVTCFFDIFSANSDSNIAILGSSVIFDQSGKKYIANYVTVANFERPLNSTFDSVSAELVWNVNTQMELMYPDVKSEISTITKATVPISIRSKGQSSTETFDFRNITMPVIQN